MTRGCVLISTNRLIATPQPCAAESEPNSSANSCCACIIVQSNVWHVIRLASLHGIAGCKQRCATLSRIVNLYASCDCSYLASASRKTALKGAFTVRRRNRLIVSLPPTFSEFHTPYLSLRFSKNLSYFSSIFLTSEKLEDCLEKHAALSSFTPQKTARIIRERR